MWNELKKWASGLKKEAESILMYHGTSSVNIPTILSNGLLANSKNKVWDNRNIMLESFQGVYLTRDLKKAFIAADDAATPPDGSGKEAGNPTIVVARIETRSPHIVLDEDLIQKQKYWPPLFLNDLKGTKEDINHALNAGLNKDKLQEWIRTLRLPEQRLERLGPEIEKFVNVMDYLNIADVIYDYSNKDYNVEQLINYIKKFENPDGTEFKIGNWKPIPIVNEDYKKAMEEFVLDVVKEYRKSLNALIVKARELTYYPSEYSDEFNVRSTENISYSGANRIIGILEFREFIEETRLIVKIIYNNDEKAINDVIEYYKRDANFPVVVEK